MKFPLVILTILVFGILFNLQTSFAHKDVHIGNITITAGWDVEPPLLNNLDSLLLMFHDNDTPIRNAMKDLTVNVQFGGVTKEVNFLPSQEAAGTYLSQIIPTQLGIYELSIEGKIKDQNIKTKINVEDVEDTGKLSFPPVESADISQNIGSQIKPIINDINRQVEENKNSNNETRHLIGELTNTVNEMKVDLNKIGLFSFVGVAIGSAAIILSSWKKFRRNN